MKVLLLAAGYGTRLTPITAFIPKCLAPIHGRPLLDYWLEFLVNGGSQSILINSHYLSPILMEYINASTWRDSVEVIFEPNLLGTAGTIEKNSSYFSNDSFMVLHADNLTSFDLNSFIAHHKNRPAKAMMTMALFKATKPSECGIVELSVDNTVKSFYEKISSPPGNLANAAMYIFEPDVIEIIRNCNKSIKDISIDIIPKLMAMDSIYTYDCIDYHRDIGTIESLSKAASEFPVGSWSIQNQKAWHKIVANYMPLQLIEDLSLQSSIDCILG